MTCRCLRLSMIWGAVALCAGVRTFSAAELKRRVLVLPFDNVFKNQNYNWMSDSIADNLKAELLKSGRFEVLDVALLRKIDPAMQFQNLSAENASAFAKRLNCEVAVVGRFTVRRAARQEIVNFEANGIDALEKKSVVVKNQDAAVNAEIFDTVGKLALTISEELNTKLRPLDASEFKRDNKLEILIRRLEHPPTGFLDDFTIRHLRLRPDFDIDRFEYDVDLDYEEAADRKTIEFEYTYWGRRMVPFVSATGMQCNKEICTVQTLTPTLVLALNNRPDALKYKVRLHYPDPRGPILARWWLTAGYPYMKSFSVAGMSNPDALNVGSGLTLDSMRGYGMLEFGLMPGRWQFLPAGIRWSVATQYAYGSGDFPQYLADNPTKVRLHLFSAGGGLRFDRLFSFGKGYSVAPFLGIYAQYQRYFRDFSAAFLDIMAINPELGVNQYFRLGQKSPWYLMISLAAGSYLYSGQNLTYFRASVGVEYVLK